MTNVQKKATKQKSPYAKFEAPRLDRYTQAYGSEASAKSAIKKAYLAYRRKERDNLAGRT